MEVSVPEVVEGEDEEEGGWWVMRELWGFELFRTKKYVAVCDGSVEACGESVEV